MQDSGKIDGRKGSSTRSWKEEVLGRLMGESDSGRLVREREWCTKAIKWASTDC
jgi:hypothetical protein